MTQPTPIAINWIWTCACGAKASRWSHYEPDTDSPCESCCDHTDLDGGECLDCGKDLTENLSAEAYDRAKAARHDD